MCSPRANCRPRHIDALAAKVAAFHRDGRRGPAARPLRRPGRHPRASRCRTSRSCGRCSATDGGPRGPRRARGVDASAACRLRVRRWRSAATTASSANATATSTSATSPWSTARPTIFDCIEFNDEMRWIDVMSEVAFTAMDLRDRGRADLAHRFLNAYLEITGDYDGLARAALLPRLSRAWCAPRSRGCAPPAARPATPRTRCDRRVRRLHAPGRRPTRSRAGRRSSSPTASPAAARRRCRRRCWKLAAPSASAPTSSANACTASSPLIARSRRASTPACTRRRRRRRPIGVRWRWRRSATAAGYVAIVDGAFLKRWQRTAVPGAGRQVRASRWSSSHCGASETTLRERIARRHA